MPAMVRRGRKIARVKGKNAKKRMGKMKRGTKKAKRY